MGLSIYDTSGNEIVRISYSGFGNFRKALARTLDFDLANCAGYDGFDNLPDHPLSILFDHSDCDGEMDWEDCLKLWPYLLAASEVIEEDWSVFCREFAESLKMCASQKLDLKFR